MKGFPTEFVTAIWMAAGAIGVVGTMYLFIADALGVWPFRRPVRNRINEFDEWYYATDLADPSAVAVVRVPEDAYELAELWYGSKDPIEADWWWGEAVRDD